MILFSLYLFTSAPGCEQASHFHISINQFTVQIKINCQQRPQIKGRVNSFLGRWCCLSRRGRGTSCLSGKTSLWPPPCCSNEGGPCQRAAAVSDVVFSPNYTMSVIGIGLSAFYILFLFISPSSPSLCPSEKPVVAKPRNYMLILQ